MNTKEQLIVDKFDELEKQYNNAVMQELKNLEDCIQTELKQRKTPVATVQINNVEGRGFRFFIRVEKTTNSETLINELINMGFQNPFIKNHPNGKYAVITYKKYR